MNRRLSEAIRDIIREMKSTISTDADGMVVMPETKIKFGLIKNPKDETMYEAVAKNQASLKGLNILFEEKEMIIKYELGKTGEEIKARIGEYSTLINAYGELQKIQEKTSADIKKRMDSIKDQVKSKEKEVADLKIQLEGKDVEMKALQTEVNDLIKKKLADITKEITQAVINDIHYILSNEAKDYKQIAIINGIVSMLRNSKTADHVTVNVSRDLISHCK